MNSQKKNTDITREKAAELIRAEFGNEAAHVNYMDYYAWPQVFSSTAGPFKNRIAGQAFTSFTIEAWVDGSHALIFCKGSVLKVISDWEGPSSVRL